MSRREAYCSELGPPRSAASARIYMAMAIALRFAHRTPSVEELEAAFGMSRSTAYRWRGAILAAKGPAPPAVLPVEHADSSAQATTAQNSENFEPHSRGVRV